MQSTTTSRANRIPRVAPRRTSSFRRLHQAIHAWYLRWLHKSLTRDRAKIEQQLSKAAQQAQANALLHRFDPALQERRQLLRADHATTCARQGIVEAELRELGRV